MFVTTGPDDEDGVCAFRDPWSDVLMPMVASDERRLYSLREKAQEIADTFRQEVRVVRFRSMEVVETITPATREGAS